LTFQNGSGHRSGRVLLLISILLAVGIVAGGAFYYRNYKNHFRLQVESQLTSIAELKAGEVSITVSVGVASGMGCSTVDELLAAADAALYEAKAAGRNRVAYAASAKAREDGS